MLALAAAWLCFCPCAHAVYNEKLIRIAILHDVPQFDVTPDGRVLLRDEATGAQRELHRRKTYQVEVDGEGINFGSFRIPGTARLVPLDPDAVMVVGPSRYQGALIVRPNQNGTLTAVSELGVEDYLLGVLPHEMEQSWPLEALKAQAVVARTFAYYNLGKYRKSGFDLTSDTRSQMYGGVGAVSPSVRRAVAETRGEVLGYKGVLLASYYHACCGGHTADYGLVWGHGAPAAKPLRGVADRYCRSSPLARWTAVLSSAEVLSALQSRRFVGGRLRDFRIGKRDKSGYVHTFVAEIGDKKVTMGADEFRKAVGATQLRSVRLASVKLRRGAVEFEGFGSGHGVGLCQWGARLQAEAGRSYEKILSYYFPGSTLSVVDE